MPRTLRLAIDSRLDEVALLAVSVRAVAGLAGLSVERLDDLELGLVEALNNVVRHGYGDRPGQPVEVAVSFEVDRVRIEIRDRGAAIPPGRLEEARLRTVDAEPSLDELPESGRGLDLILATIDEVDYRSERGWNLLRLEQRLTATPG